MVDILLALTYRDWSEQPTPNRADRGNRENLPCDRPPLISGEASGLPNNLNRPKRSGPMQLVVHCDDNADNVLKKKWLIFEDEVKIRGVGSGLGGGLGDDVR